MANKRPVTLMHARPQAAPPPQNLGEAFGVEFQGMLLRLLLEDSSFSRQVAKYLEPKFFQNEAMAWAFGFSQWYQSTYGTFPSLAVVIDQTRTLDPNVQPIFQAVMSGVRERRVTDEPWLRDQTLDFIKRQVFRSAYLDSHALFNAGKVTEAYDLMQARMDELNSVTWEIPDRQWLMDEFPDRHIQRQTLEAQGRYTGTGIPVLDETLGGGAQPGFLGVWLARPKAGKTTFLVNKGAIALRAYHRRVLHVPLEGSGAYIADRYDTIFTDELYANVRRGEIDATRYSMAYQEMQMHRQQCVIRAFTDEWDYNITHVWNEMRELKQSYGWEPDLVIVDYCDLLEGRPRPGGYKSDTDSQKASFKDLKSLANRGFAVWTASQVQRPKDKDFDDVQDILKSKDIADCYAKVRIADMVGSINQTREERKQGVMRLYVELLRDNAADVEMLIPADFQKMKIGGDVVPPATMQTTTVQTTKALGYGAGQWQQKRGV